MHISLSVNVYKEEELNTIKINELSFNFEELMVGQILVECIKSFYSTDFEAKNSTAVMDLLHSL